MTEKLTDEQLRATSEGDDCAYKRAMAAELLALRAERAKPAPSDDMSKDHVAQAKEIASRFRNSDRAGYKGWGVIYQAIATIRAEGSAERVKLESRIRQHREQISQLQDTVMKLKGGASEALSQPAESGATDIDVLTGTADDQGLFAIPDAESGATEHEDIGLVKRSHHHLDAGAKP